MSSKIVSTIKRALSRTVIAVLVLQNFVLAVPASQAVQSPGAIVKPMVSAGNSFSMALKTDGTVWAWGHGAFGELGDGAFSSFSLTPVQVATYTGLTTATAIAAGNTHALALSSDGTVWAWGKNANGQLGDGSNTDSGVPVQVSGLTDVTAISAGDQVSAALKSDGTVWAWGIGTNGQLGNGANSSSNVPVQVSGISTATAIDIGNYHTVALLSDGTVRSWGYNNLGQLGNGSNTDSNVPVTVSGLSGVTSVAAGDYFSIALKSDGTVRTWGRGGFGNLGNGSNSDSNVPVTVSGLSGVTSVAAGIGDHVIARKSDGTARSWGFNANGQLGNGNTGTNSNVPVTVSGLSGVTSVAAGVAHSLALLSDGTVRSWGFNNAGQLGDGTFTTRNTPVTVTSFNLYVSPYGMIAIAGGYKHTLALRVNGTVWAWGYNASGQLGDGSNTDSNVPVQVTGLTSVVAVAAGFGHSLALKSDGTVWAWGSNGNGALGNGSFSDSSTPVQVSGLTDAVAIAAGNLHSLALKADGTVVAWGYNTDGELGNGSNTDSNVPVTVTGLSGAHAIAGGGSHSAALLDDGTVRTWGHNDQGQLGDGTNFDSNVAVTVSGLSGVSAIASGVDSTYAVLSDGTARAWGNNLKGELGNGANPTDSNVPVTVTGLSNVASIATGAGGGNHAIVSLADGTSWAWGWNLVGALGDGTTTDSNVPVQVTGLANVKAVSKLAFGSVALLSDGTVWDWGYGTDGELGNCFNAHSSVPVQVNFVGCVAPDAVTDLAANSGSSSATLTWTAPFQGGAPITSYEVHYSNNGFTGNDVTCVTLSCTDTTTGATVSGLTNGVLYTFRVYAINAIGTSSVSNDATATPSFWPTPAATLNPGYGMGIVNVTLTGDGSPAINNNTSEYDTYTDYSGTQAGSPTSTTLGIPILSPSGSYTFNGTPGSFYDETFSVWIDFNHDGAFDDGEKIVDNNFTTASTPISVPFNVPGGATLGVTRMRIGTDYDVTPVDSPALGPLQYGEWEDYAVSIGPLAPAGPSLNTTNNVVVLSREAINATATATIYFTLNDTLSSQLTLSFDSAFTGLNVSGASASTPSSPGCMSNFVATDGHTFTADKSSCTGPVIISGVTVVNPPTAGPYLVSWVNDDPGYAMVAIVDSDQVTVNAQVDPTITFDLNTGTTNAPVSAPYSVALGSLTLGAVNHSDNSGVNSVWANLDTNATGGAVVTVLSANAALKSLSVGTDTIPNAAGSMAAGTANYGLCVNSVSGPTAANGTFQASAPYDSGTCDPAGSANAVKALSTVTPTSILDSNANPVTTGSAEILVNAAISTATVAHSDYADVLTFVATGTF